MDIDHRTHTALHVIKGAIQKVLGAKWTASTSSSGTHGRIAVQFDRKPTDEEIKQIQDLSNQKVMENVPIEIHSMNREEAETRWGNIIYDLFPLPDYIKEIQICQIPGWNVNACNKKHTKKTGQIGKIKVTKTRYRNSKQLLEVSFDIE
jgi:alanyl-tRNA synthetase